MRFLLIAIYYLYYHFGFSISKFLAGYQRLISSEAYKSAAYMDALFFYTVISVFIITTFFSKTTTNSLLRAYGNNSFTGYHVVLFYVTILILVLNITFSIPSMLSGDLTSHRQDLVKENIFLGFINKFLVILGPYLFITFTCAEQRLRAYTLLVLIFTANLFTGQKMPMLLTIYLYFLATGAVKNKFSYSRFIIGILACLPILILYVFLTNKELLSVVNFETLTIAMRALWTRMFLIGPISVYDYFVTFPDGHNFLLFVRSELPADQIVYNYRYSTGLFGTQNTFSYGNFYAYWGNLYVAVSLCVLVTLCLIYAHFSMHYLTKTKNEQTSLAILLLYLLPIFILTDARTALEFPVLFIVTIAMYIELRTNISGQWKIRQQVPVFLVCAPLILFFVQGQIRGLLNLYF